MPPDGLRGGGSRGSMVNCLIKYDNQRYHGIKMGKDIYIYLKSAGFRSNIFQF